MNDAPARAAPARPVAAAPGPAAAGGHGAVSAGWVLGLAAVIVAAAAAARPGFTPLAALAGWLTACGFSAPPYAQLRLAGPGAGRAAVVIGAAAVGGVLLRWLASVTLGVMNAPRAPGGRLPLARGLDRRRQLAGVAMVALMPLLTMALEPARHSLSLPDDLLIYLVGVVAVAVVGGFWAALLAAVAGSLLVNWYFTPPVHTFTIADPQNMLSLLLFVTVAVAVSSVVHLAARRAVQAARSGEDAAALLALAQTVLGGQDTPAAILAHLTATRGGSAELAERVGGQWVRVACSGTAPDAAPRTSVPAAQAAAALGRDRLRTQAAQAEALAEGNRMRTALLAAVSHDLRTPLASIKASVSTLRQAGVELAAPDRAALLATIEDSADRLNGLIANLLDMSRLSAGSLEPFLRPASVDEAAPLPEPGSPLTVRLEIPEHLPLVRTDPGLLERVLANLFANAIAHSPPGRPPVMTARAAGGAVLIDVIDHGPGVPDRLKAVMFEPFERLGERGTGTGVGMGLAVAKGFLDAMGGSITALDTPGGGLTMRVTLPVAAGRDEKAGPPGEAAPPGTTARP